MGNIRLGVFFLVPFFFYLSLVMIVKKLKKKEKKKGEKQTKGLCKVSFACINFER